MLTTATKRCNNALVGAIWENGTVQKYLWTHQQALFAIPLAPISNVIIFAFNYHRTATIMFQLQTIHICLIDSHMWRVRVSLQSHRSHFESCTKDIRRAQNLDWKNLQTTSIKHTSSVPRIIGGLTSHCFIKKTFHDSKLAADVVPFNICSCWRLEESVVTFDNLYQF